MTRADSMRILFTAQPASGHLHPLVPIALAAREAGHEVRFALGPEMCPAVERHGFMAIRAGSDLDDADVQRVLAEVQTESDPASAAMTKLFAGILAERMIPDLDALFAQWRPDIVVSEMSEYASWVVAEKHRVRRASVLFGIHAPAAVFVALAGPALQALRRQAGLDPDPELKTLEAEPNFMFSPQRYQPPHIPLPSTVHVFRPAVFDQSGDEGLPDWINDRADRLLVYATLGTAFNETAGVLEAIVEAARDAVYDLVLTVGRNRDPAALGPLPANVRVERYIPQSLILPYCDAVLCHGGYSTVMAALSEGLPMVLTPVGADQPLHAEMCRALGVGLVVEPRELTTETVRAAVSQVLEDASYRAHARSLQQEMMQLPGIDQAVRLLERLATAPLGSH